MKRLESEVCESTVGLSHAVHILLTLERTTLVVEGVHDLSGQLLSHALATALACEGDHILHGDTLLAVGTNLSRNLERSTTDTAALHLHLRSDVVEGLLPNLKRGLLLVLHLGAYELEGSIEDLIRGILLTVVHQVVDKLGDLLVIELRIREDHMLLWFCFSHFII